MNFSLPALFYLLGRTYGQTSYTDRSAPAGPLPSPRLMTPLMSRGYAPDTNFQEDMLSHIEITDKMPSETQPSRATLFINPSQKLCFSYVGTASPEAHIFRLPDTLSRAEFLHAVYSAIQESLTWEVRMSRILLTACPAADLLSLGQDMLCHEYFLVDSDMNILFASEGFFDIFHDQPSQTLSRELTETLMMQNAFHQVAKEEEPFYFHEADSGTFSYCSNIFINGRYYARLLAILPPPFRELPIGERCFFRKFASYIQYMLQNDRSLLRRHQNDELHLAFRELASQETVHPDRIENSLAAYGWRKDDSYILLFLTPSADRDWKSQPETTLPFLVRELEHSFSHACAVRLDQDIALIVNLTQTEGGTDESGFLQRSAAFVRDHACSAGCSTVWTGFESLYSSLEQAKAALRMGKAAHSSFWIFTFADYRLPYLVSRLTGPIPASKLLHPAVTTLLDYDREHQSDLLASLKAYLENGQNATAAAQSLYVHRTTFCRRMEHIIRLTRISLPDPDTELEILLSLRMLRQEK